MRRWKSKLQCKMPRRKKSRPIEVIHADGGGNAIIKTAASTGYQIIVDRKHYAFDTNLGRAEYRYDNAARPE